MHSTGVELLTLLRLFFRGNRVSIEAISYVSLFGDLAPNLGRFQTSSLEI